MNLDASRTAAQQPAPSYPDICFAADNFEDGIDEMVCCNLLPRTSCERESAACATAQRLLAPADLNCFCDTCTACSCYPSASPEHWPVALYTGVCVEPKHCVLAAGTVELIGRAYTIKICLHQGYPSWDVSSKGHM